LALNNIHNFPELLKLPDVVDNLFEFELDPEEIPEWFREKFVKVTEDENLNVNQTFYHSIFDRIKAHNNKRTRDEELENNDEVNDEIIEPPLQRRRYNFENSGGNSPASQNSTATNEYNDEEIQLTHNSSSVNRSFWNFFRMQIEFIGKFIFV